MSSYSVNTNAMAQGVEDVRRCHNALVNQKADLESFLGPLKSTWVGQGGDNWANHQRAWDQAAEDVYLVLLKLHNALSTSHTNYTATEANVAGKWL